MEAIADSTGWDWRAAGVRFTMGFYPADCCHWGVYERPSRSSGSGRAPSPTRTGCATSCSTSWPTAGSTARTASSEFISDYSRWGFGTIGPALEAGADCVADVWGALRGHYWNCPADAQALAARRLGGDWR